MSYEKTMKRLELLKAALVCGCLFMVFCGSCVSSQRSATVLEKVMRLQYVMQEAAERGANCEVNVAEQTEQTEDAE